MLFGKYVCVLFFVPLMKWYGILLRMGKQDPLPPNPNVIRAALALANANNKAINAIFYGVSTDEFHRISHVKTAKEAWTILETTYKGTKKVKDTKLQMLTTRFEKVKMIDDESFDSFYGRLNEIVIAKLSLEEKTKDAKVVRKFLRSLPESF